MTDSKRVPMLVSILKEILYEINPDPTVHNTRQPSTTTLNYDTLYEFAYEHKVATLVHNWITRVDKSGAFTISTRQHRLRRMQILQTCMTITDIFQQHEISFIMLKGPALSQRLYNSPLKRDYTDMDCLVKHDDFDTAIRLLQSHGYKHIETDDTHHVVLKLPDNLVSVELHFALTIPGYSKLYHDDTVWDNLDTVTIQSRQIPVLNAEYTLVYLCHHGNRHLWERLQWAMDIAVIITTTNPDWNRIHYLSQSLAQYNSTLLGLYFVSKLFEIPLPSLVSQWIAEAPVIVEISNQLYACYNQENDRQTLVYSRVIVLIHERRIDQLKHLCRELFNLTDADRAFTLPRYLGWLYYPIRLFRIMRIYTSGKLFRSYN